jgi:hypothetical protein
MSFQDLDITESWPNSSNDMMQYVTCSKYSLFAHILKTLEKQWICFLNVIEVRNINVFLCGIKVFMNNIAMQLELN